MFCYQIWQEKKSIVTSGHLIAAMFIEVVRLRSLVIALIGVLGLFHGHSAGAVISCPTSVTIQWYYGGDCYSSQAQAVAAMQSDPHQPSNAVATQMAGSSLETGGSLIVYSYLPPSPLPLNNPMELYVGHVPGATYPDEQSAISATLQSGSFGSSFNTGCGNATVSLLNDWYLVSNASFTPPDVGPTYQRDYNWILFQKFSDGSCHTQTGVDFIHIAKYFSGTCPMYYHPTLPPVQCVANFPGGAEIGARALDCSKPSTMVGDPCDAASGDFSQTENDYAGAGLTFTRYYHSATLESFHGLGVGWTHNYAARLILLTPTIPGALMRPNGHQELLTSNSRGSYVTLSGNGIHALPANAAGNFVVVFSDGSEEIYNSVGVLTQLVSTGGAVTTLNYTNGLLSSVVGPYGHSLTLAYNAANNINTVTDQSGHTIVYSYDAVSNLNAVQYQDGTSRAYQYTDASLPNNLTGILDESGGQLLTVAYDANGHASTSQNAGGANAVSLTYGATSATVTDGLGGTTVFGFSTFGTGDSFSARVASVAHNSLASSYVIPAPSTDPQQRATQMTDANGNVTNYAYDADHLTSTTEAFGTAQARTTSYQYLSTTSSLPVLITEPTKQTSLAYFAGTSLVHTKTTTDTTVTPNVARTWRYTYDGFGHLLTADGPRTDVGDTTTYSYYTCSTGAQCGQVQTITDALGHITTFNTYNAHGQPLTVTDPNGVVTTLTYDFRQRLTSRQIGAETTSYSYYPTGLLRTATSPDGSSITKVYDGAHRLTDITDGIGNHIHYTLDSMGNRTAENTYDPGNTLKRTHSRVINTLNEISADINAAGTAAVTTTLTYDNNGNLVGSAAPLGRSTTNQYDALNRLKQITDPNAGVTQYSYDANDQLTSVVDPRSLTTTYTRNGFGDVKASSSPDTGTTTRTYDSGGNLKTSTDARGAVTTYTYDALNRVSQVAYTDQTINFSYDAGTNGVGRLTGASDANHALSWAYDSHGRIAGKGQTIGTVTQSVGYAYVNGDPTSLVTPSGQTVVYGYSNHRITSITLNGTTILSGATYDPFGPVTGWTWGNGTSASRTFDQDGKVTQLQSGGETYSYSYDNAFRITGIANTANSNLSWTYGYDNLDRLSGANTSALSESWTYDANGNRLTQGGTYPMTLVVSPTSNQITSGSSLVLGSGTASYDASGNTTVLQGNTGSYNGAGRMASANFNGASAQFIYNALGERVYKNASGSGVTLFMYDERHHLIGEYGGNGNLIEETVWMDDTPVATLRPSGSGIAIYYVHTDHLNRPRKISVPGSNALVWRADLDPFEVFPADNVAGDGVNLNPSGLGNFVYNIGLPGQYYDPETTNVYNLNRDYAASLGRYLESDPIGLAGGINTYAYAKGNPIGRVDPMGLASAADEARAMGLTHPPEVRPETKDEICNLLKPYDYNFQSADILAVELRDKFSYTDPTLQEADDFLNAAGWPYPLSVTNWTLSAYIYQFQKLLPKPLQLLPGDTSFSLDALDATLAGLNHQNQQRIDVKKWCKSCDRT